MKFVLFLFMQESIAVGISLPKKIVERIDNDRQDIPRSRYVLRLLENSYLKKNSKIDSLDLGLEGLNK
jgi:hypothetical protein